MRNNRSAWVSAAPIAIVMYLSLACAQERTATEEGATATTTTGTTTAAPASTDTTSTTVQLQGEDAIAVSLVDYRIQMPQTLPAGPAEFKVTNNGENEHDFRIHGNGIDRKLERPLKPLEVATLAVNLQPGTYQVECPYDNHDEKHDMRTQLTVTSAAGNPPVGSPAAGTATSG